MTFSDVEDSPVAADVLWVIVELFCEKQLFIIINSHNHLCVHVFIIEVFGFRLLFSGLWFYSPCD